MPDASTHPRPLLTRPHWTDLSGSWRFAFDDEARWQTPNEVHFDRQIRVPYPPESVSSGIHDTGFHPVLWYAHTLELTSDLLPQPAERLLLHFEAVDYQAQVWVNGEFVTEHQGGHTPFSADLTRFVRRAEALQSGVLEIVVRAQDDPHDLGQPRGKQDWREQAHVIWYPRTSGIWQTVWLEKVPETFIQTLEWSCTLQSWQISLSATLEGPLSGQKALEVTLSQAGTLLALQRVSVRGRRVSCTFTLEDPGIDDERNALLWSPEHPHLIEAELRLIEALGSGEQVLDQVSSYTAMRDVGTDGRRFLLNGHAYYLKLVLDQGYWPDSLMTASDAQLRSDVEWSKRLGFNGVRKHQKVESRRFLYWCDVLGLLVWEEMPSHYRFSSEAVLKLLGEWTEVLERDRSHPCIVAWVPFNESWGVPELTRSPVQTHYVQALYHLTKTLDPSRLAIGNDGWEWVVGDWVGIHDYSHTPDTLLERYGTPQAVTQTVTHPWGRALKVSGFDLKGKPYFLSEFGGIAYAQSDDERGWGYSRVQSADLFLERYRELLEGVYALEGIAGFCYTQLTDTGLEKNGLLHENREPKAEVKALAQATQGERNAHEADLDGELHPLGYSKRWWLERTRVESA